MRGPLVYYGDFLELFFRVIRHQPLLSSVDTKDTSRCIIRAKKKRERQPEGPLKEEISVISVTEGTTSSRNGHPARHRLLCPFRQAKNGQRSSKHNKPAANDPICIRQLVFVFQQLLFVPRGVGVASVADSARVNPHSVMDCVRK